MSDRYIIYASQAATEQAQLVAGPLPAERTAAGRG